MDLNTELRERLQAAGINTDIGQRWEAGQAHHPEAEKLGRSIGALDWLFADDSFGFNFGGDGDNGETLIYLLDLWFELKDAEAKIDIKPKVELKDLIQETESHFSYLYITGQRKGYYETPDNGSGWVQIAFERFDHIECSIYRKLKAALAENDQAWVEQYGQPGEEFIFPGSFSGY